MNAPLTLDARQRAMLAEMGVRVWQPKPPAPPPETARTAAVNAPEKIASFQDSTWDKTQKHSKNLPPDSTPQAAPPAAGPRPQDVALMDWPALQAAVAGCQACGLCAGRTHTVFGVGSRQAEWMVVGEAPGEQEDRQGQPFVGQAGKLLDRMLAAIGLTRADDADPAKKPAGVYIANVLKCRPPGNRNPQPEEIARCEPYLRRQVALLRPKIILALGRFAVQTLLQTTEPIGRLRGRVHLYEDVPVIVSYHPAYLLRALPEKAKAWEDLCLALATRENIEGV
ncbi:MAG: uracil-DNA glycosylase [Burkholderiaceae bacterium]|jgi:DNA polymerase|nr:uracil-DNA glycosylase [Burkholderiaceae bacterium]